MFLFLRRRLLRFIAAAVVLPLIGAVAVRVSNELEGRRGKSVASTVLRRGGLFLNRKPSRA